MLSMFAAFEFDWPPAIKAIYSAFSLVNLNFELLAPECSVSVNYEAKWCVECRGHCTVSMCATSVPMWPLRKARVATDDNGTLVGVPPPHPGV